MTTEEALAAAVRERDHLEQVMSQRLAAQREIQARTETELREANARLAQLRKDHEGIKDFLAIPVPDSFVDSWMRGRGGIVTQTKVERMYPPAQLLQPMPEPGKPPVPDRELVLEDVILWYEDYLSHWRAAFRQAEADKKAIRAWTMNLKDWGKEP